MSYYGFKNEDTYGAAIIVDNDEYLHELAGIWHTTVEQLAAATRPHLPSWVNRREVDWQELLDRAQSPD